MVLLSHTCLLALSTDILVLSVLPVTQRPLVIRLEGMQFETALYMAEVVVAVQDIPEGNIG